MSQMIEPRNTIPIFSRIGDLRVYYDVEDKPEPIVYIRAIGIKERNRVKIGKEVINL